MKFSQNLNFEIFIRTRKNNVELKNDVHNLAKQTQPNDDDAKALLQLSLGDWWLERRRKYYWCWSERSMSDADANTKRMKKKTHTIFSRWRLQHIEWERNKHTLYTIALSALQTNTRRYTGNSSEYQPLQQANVLYVYLWVHIYTYTHTHVRAPRTTTCTSLSQFTKSIREQKQQQRRRWWRQQSMWKSSEKNTSKFFRSLFSSILL